MSQARGRLIVFLFGGTALIACLFFARSFWNLKGAPYEQLTNKRLKILAYSSFMGSTGPGLQLVEDFKKACQCSVEVSIAGDAGLLLERMQLSKKDQFDLVIGFDQFALSVAEKKFKWREWLADSTPWVDSIKPHVSPHFLPFDWAPMTFIYRKGEIEPPKSLNDLLEDEYRGRIAMQDPRSSTPGLAFYQWVIAVKGEQASNYFQKLKSNIQSVSPSWSFSYGLFKKGLAKVVFSYVTSLVYHWEIESDRRYQAASFSEGHPYQVEFMGIPENCTECQLAQQFAMVMLTKDGQKHLAQKNFMFPVVKDVELPKVYSELPKLKLIDIPVDKNLQVWTNVFGK